MPQADVFGTQTGDPGLSYGLNGISDWGVSQPFLDVFKTSRPWIGHLDGQWGGYENEEMAAAGILDENGYLTEMPEGVNRVETFVLTEMPAEALDAAGRYRLTYEGEGDVQVQFGATNVTYVDGEIWFDYEPNGENMVSIAFTSTDPNDTGDYLRNFSLVKEDHIESLEAGEIFNPVWLDVIDETHAVRFMDWMQTNNSTVETWDDMPNVGDASWATGVPIEVMVELANQIGSEPWFNIPHNADDDFIRTFAEYVRDNLDPGIRAHFEFSNEVWNWQFEQAHDSAADSNERFGEERGDGWVQEYGARSSEMAVILDDVFSGEEDRLVKVIATQTGWIGLEEYILEASEYVALDPENVAPYTHFDTYAVTGYFSGALGNEKAWTVLSWIEDSLLEAETQADANGLTGEAREAWISDHRYDLATDLAIQEMRDGSVTGDPMGSLQELFGMFEYHAAVAAEHGLDMVMYEGGTHVVTTGSYTGNEVLSEFFIHLNYSEGMGDLYAELLDGWVEAGGTLFNAFVEVARPSQWGSWGSLRYLGDETSRNDALESFAEDYPRPYTPTPDPDTEVDWTHPDTDFTDPDNYEERVDGTDGRDRIEGSDGDDFIETGDGNDLIYGSGGADHHNGGAGLGDRVQYLDRAGIVIDMNDPTSSTGSAYGDSFAGIERIQGADGGDTIRLAANATGYGKGGDDTIVDSDGREIMRGGAGADTFVIASQDGQADIIKDYERGVDTIDLSSWGCAWEDLKVTGRPDGRAFLEIGDDTLIINDGWDPRTGTHMLDRDDFILNPEDVIDIIFEPTRDWSDPSIYDEVIDGTSASDRIQTGDADEYIFTGDGNDLIYGSAGADYHDGGAGLGDRVQYHDIEGIVIDMNDATASTGSAYGDSFVNIERIQAGGGDDTIRLAENTTGYGKGGNDRIVDSDGREIMKGGSGSDVFVFASRDAAADIIQDFEFGVDAIDVSAWDTTWSELDISSGGRGRAIISVDGDSLIIEGGWDDETEGHLLSQDDFLF